MLSIIRQIVGGGTRAVHRRDHSRRNREEMPEERSERNLNIERRDGRNRFQAISVALAATRREQTRGRLSKLQPRMQDSDARLNETLNVNVSQANCGRKGVHACRSINGGDEEYPRRSKGSDSLPWMLKRQNVSVS